MDQLNEYARRDALIIRMQSALLDYTGHVRAALALRERRRLVRTINQLREANGWERLNMHGR